MNDGVNSYTYNSANQLTAMSGPFGSSVFSYNGLGDRLTQNGVNYTLDLNAGLIQVLSDGTNQYLYGLGRIAQVNTSTEYLVSTSSTYHLPDALGSVRQLTDASGQVTLANAYEPYGNLAQTAGSAQTSYGFTGEWTDPSGLVYLRARYYAPEQGRFITRDTWEGNDNFSQSQNRYVYSVNNPILYTDPSGHFPQIIAGALLGATIGLIGGYTFAGLTYRWALSGECGCEMQQWAQNVGTGWVHQTALMSMLIGAAAGAIATAAPIGAIAVGGFSIGASTVDLLRMEWGTIMQNGMNKCDVMRFAVDIVGIAGGLLSIGVGTAGALQSGSLTSWKSPATVYNARTTAEVARSVLEGINPKFFKPNNRFGPALYAAERSGTATAELNAHGVSANYILRFRIILSKVKVLDLTNPKTAKAWGVPADTPITDYTPYQAMATKALGQGYNAIKFPSFRDTGGINYALLPNFKFSEWLIPDVNQPFILK